MDDRIETFRNFLQAIWRSQSQAWKATLPAELAGIHVATQGAFPPLDEMALEAFLPSATKMSGISSIGNRYLYLPPLPEQDRFIPVLSFNYSPSEKRKGETDMKFSMHLVTLHDGQIHALGYRFETPHGRGPAGPGAHDFHHVQLCQEYDGAGGNRKALPNCPEWIPTTQPSFPMPARDYVELLVCLMVSLYGGNWTKAIQPASIHNFAKYADISTFLAR